MEQCCPTFLTPQAAVEIIPEAVVHTSKLKSNNWNLFILFLTVLWVENRTFQNWILRSNRTHNPGISRAPLKSQVHQGTSLFTSAATNQRGCPKSSPWYAQI